MTTNENLYSYDNEFNMDVMLKCVRDTIDRLEKGVCSTGKERQTTTLSPAILAGKILVARGGTIAPDLESEEIKQIGLKQLWIYLCYHYPIEAIDQDRRFIKFVKNPKTLDDHTKHILADKNYDLMTRAFDSLKWHIESDHGILLIMVSRENHRKYREVITLNPDYEVRPGYTAAQADEEQNTERAICILRSVGRRLGITKGLETTEEYYNRISGEMSKQAEQLKLPFDDSGG